MTGKTQIITRKSIDSNVTIPYEKTFRNLDKNRPQEGAALEEFNFCVCGWPHHMLIPKGNAAGFPCDLFVTITNYEEDQVSASPLSFVTSFPQNICN